MLGSSLESAKLPSCNEQATARADMDKPKMKFRYSAHLGVISIALMLPGCGRPPESVAAGTIVGIIGISYVNFFDPPKIYNASGHPSNVCSQNDIARFLESDMTYNQLSHLCRVSNSAIHNKTITISTNSGDKYCIKLKQLFQDRISDIISENSFSDNMKLQTKYHLEWLLKTYNIDTSCKDEAFSVILKKI